MRYARLLVSTVVLTTLVADNRAAPAERHVVTATLSEWVYRDFRSGEGESNAVRIFARPGDEIEFRQSSGRHGVFFYRTPLDADESELGEAVDVMRDFELAGDRDRLAEQPLPNSLFPRQSVTTPEYSGRRWIVTIRLKTNFRDPIYFGDLKRSVRNGNVMFGVIMPADHRHPPPERVELPDDFESFRAVVRTPRYEWQRGVLGNLNKSRDGRVFVYEEKGLFVAPYDNLAEIDRENPKTDTWFARTRALSPARSRWYYASPVDTDADNDLDLVVCASLDGDRPAWWLLTSNVAQTEGPAGTWRFERHTRIAVGPAPEEAGQAFAVATDLNNDGRPDLVLYNGAAEGRLNIHLSRRVYRYPGEQYRAIDPLALADLGLADVSFVYPVDADFDGWIDLLVSSVGKPAMIFFNRAPGRLVEGDSTELPAILPPVQRVGLHDADGDLRSDIIVEGTDGQRVIVYNRGERQFSLERRDK